ncbi:MAG: hypothetical protein ABFC96_08850 [Thermoguttaceae bacterium]
MCTRDINQISGHIVDAAMKVHSALGPGLLELTPAIESTCSSRTPVLSLSLRPLR